MALAFQLHCAFYRTFKVHADGVRFNAHVCVGYKIPAFTMSSHAWNLLSYKRTCFTSGKPLKTAHIFISDGQHLRWYLTWMSDITTKDLRGLLRLLETCVSAFVCQNCSATLWHGSVCLFWSSQWEAQKTDTKYAKEPPGGEERWEEIKR